MTPYKPKFVLDSTVAPAESPHFQQQLAGTGPSREPWESTCQSI